MAKGMSKRCESLLNRILLIGREDTSVKPITVLSDGARLTAAHDSVGLLFGGLETGITAGEIIEGTVDARTSGGDEGLITTGTAAIALGDDPGDDPALKIPAKSTTLKLSFLYSGSIEW